VHFVEAEKLFSAIFSLEHFQDDVKNAGNVKNQNQCFSTAQCEG